MLDYYEKMKNMCVACDDGILQIYIVPLESQLIHNSKSEVQQAKKTVSDPVGTSRNDGRVN